MTTELAEQRNTTMKNIEDLYQFTLNGKTPSWIKNLKQSAFNRFQQVGIPTVKDEEWKYINVAPIFKQTYQRAPVQKTIDLGELKAYISPNDINIVFINGQLSKELSNIKNLPKGFKILSLDLAATSCEAKLKDLLNRYDINKSPSFVALNTAMMQSGVYMEVDKNIVSKNLVHIIHVADTASDKLFINPRTIVQIGALSEISILESHLTVAENSIYFTNAMTDLFIDEGAHLSYNRAQKESEKSFFIGTSRAWLERNANLRSLIFSTAGSITRNNLEIILNGEGANAELNGLYSIFNHQLVDNHTCVEHRQPNCISNQLYKGIINDSSHAVFNGKILVDPLAQGTNSYQLNKNLLLGKEARIDTKPQLEIFADDVKCTHGATIGQLNPDEIFYLQSRCISRKAATKILAEGFAEDLIERSQHEAVITKLNQLLQPSLAHL